MMSYFIPEKDSNQISSRRFLSQFVTTNKNSTPSRNLRKGSPFENQLPWFLKINFFDFLSKSFLTIQPSNENNCNYNQYSLITHSMPFIKPRVMIIQMASNSRCFNLKFFNFMMVRELYASSRNLMSDFEFLSFLGLVIGSTGLKMLSNGS